MIRGNSAPQGVDISKIGGVIARRRCTAEPVCRMGIGKQRH